MDFRDRMKHMADVVALMRDRLLLSKTYFVSGGIYHIRFGSQGNLEWWGICRDDEYYRMYKLNHQLSFRVRYISASAEMTVDEIREELVNNAHYKFD